MAESAIPSTGEVDVAIAGAGAAGLAAARHLGSRRPSLVIAVLEAAAWPGGRALTVDAPAIGAPLDLGCGWLHGARDNPWTGIAENLGFTIDRTPPPWDQQHENLGFPPEEQADYERAASAF
jgi:monoamine oxidase